MQKRLVQRDIHPLYSQFGDVPMRKEKSPCLKSTLDSALQQYAEGRYGRDLMIYKHKIAVIILINNAKVAIAATEDDILFAVSDS